MEINNNLINNLLMTTNVSSPWYLDFRSWNLNAHEMITY